MTTELAMWFHIFFSCLNENERERDSERERERGKERWLLAWLGGACKACAA